MELVCNIEIIKDGKDFVIRAKLSNGATREYRNPVFENVLTEMMNDLQEELSE